MSAELKTGEKYVYPMALGRLTHLKAEIAAFDRKLSLRRFNWSKHDVSRAIIRDRLMRNCGMKPGNALNPAWEWLHPNILSRTRP